MQTTAIPHTLQKVLRQAEKTAHVLGQLALENLQAANSGDKCFHLEPTPTRII